MKGREHMSKDYTVTLKDDGNLYCSRHGYLGEEEKAMRENKVMYQEQTYYCMDCIGEDTAESVILEHLTTSGVQVSWDDTSFTLRYSFVQVTAPSLNLALLAFVERLLLLVPVENA
jgi:hypothetical protein